MILVSASVLGGRMAPHMPGSSRQLWGLVSSKKYLWLFKYFTWWLIAVNRAVSLPRSLKAFSRCSPPWTTVVLNPRRRSLAPTPTNVIVKEERSRQAETFQLGSDSWRESRVEVSPSGKSFSTSVIVCFPFLQTFVSPINTPGNMPGHSGLVGGGLGILGSNFFIVFFCFLRPSHMHRGGKKCN